MLYFINFDTILQESKYPLPRPSNQSRHNIMYDSGHVMNLIRIPNDHILRMNKLLEEAARYLGEEIPSVDDETDEQGQAWDDYDDLWNFLLSIRVQIQCEVGELHGREELEEVDQVQDESDTSMPALE